MNQVTLVENEDDLLAVAMQMKFYAVAKQVNQVHGYSKDIDEFIKNYSNQNVIDEIMKGGFDRVINIDNELTSLVLTVELARTIDGFKAGDQIWHLSMSMVGMPPRKVTEELAQRIFKAFFPEKDYIPPASFGILKDVRHYLLNYP